MWNTVLREEKKYLLRVDEFIKLAHTLSAILPEDPHNGREGYTVRSLYFDTVYDGDYFEKLDGLEARRKIRLRCYDPKAEFALLEMKQKQGECQQKRSLKLSRTDAEALIRGDYVPLLRYPEPFARECYGLMHCRLYRPKTIVQYRRKAFLSKGSDLRITFDHTISATEGSFDLFDGALCLSPVLDPSQVVLEVKPRGILLDYIKRLLNSVDRSTLSVSKYALARQTGYQAQ